MESEIQPSGKNRQKKQSEGVRFGTQNTVPNCQKYIPTPTAIFSKRFLFFTCQNAIVRMVVFATSWPANVTADYWERSVNCVRPDTLSRTGSALSVTHACKTSWIVSTCCCTMSRMSRTTSYRQVSSTIHRWRWWTRHFRG